MSNSKLVTHVNISPNRTSPRNHEIDTITPHHVAGNLSIETIGRIFASATRRASSNYGIGSDGRIGMYCEEKDRPWTSGSKANDHRAVTIEVSNITGAPTWKISDKAIEALIDLCTDICQRNNIPKLLWKNDPSLIGQPTKQSVTIHKWFQKTTCPAADLESKLGYVADEVNRRLLGGTKMDNGDKVKIKSSATKYMTGETIASKYKGVEYTIADIGNADNGRTGGARIKELVSWVWLKDLEPVKQEAPTQSVVPRYVYDQQKIKIERLTKDIESLQSTLRKETSLSSTTLAQLNKANDEIKLLTSKINAEIKENSALEESLSTAQTNFKNLKVMYNESAKAVSDLSVEYTALEQKNLELSDKVFALESDAVELKERIAQLEKLEVAADVIDWKDAKPGDLIVHAIRVLLKIEV